MTKLIFGLNFRSFEICAIEIFDWVFSFWFSTRCRDISIVLYSNGATTTSSKRNSCYTQIIVTNLLKQVFYVRMEIKWDDWYKFSIGVTVSLFFSVYALLYYIYWVRNWQFYEFCFEMFVFNSFDHFRIYVKSIQSD